MSDGDECLPLTITRTRLWKTTLAVHDGSQEKNARQDLQVAFRQFRKKARLLAAEIPRYLPEFTDHSIDHLDALWEMADRVIGDSAFELNPAEAFVFGSAVLVHDCAMSFAAYPGRMDDIERDPAWADTITALYLERFSAYPTPKQVHEPDEEIRNRALSTLLRLRHAERAEALTGMVWKDSDGKTYSLIVDERLRDHFGEVIGKVAHSHHWSVERLTRDLPSKLGTLGGLPPDWEIDPLKVACLLRIADACHLDERRAPGFLRAIRDLPEFSDRHWRFQNRLAVPIKNGDSLVFVANRAFRPEETASWWLCYDTLTMVDRELREIDALLGQQRRHRLAVRRVAGAGAPERLAEYVRTIDWQPVDAKLFIGDIPQLIERLGGEKLYGDRPWVAVRELLENATDAVRARRVLDGLSQDWGAVTIWVEENTAAGAWYLHVEDNGTGMSTACVRDYLLNFGASYWTSDLARKEHPGLIASGIRQTGQFGIGFFSIFMVGSAVRVVTRQLRGAAIDTVVLEFSRGVAGRPLFRDAKPNEQLRDSGTRVSVCLSKSPFTDNGLLHDERAPYNTLAGLVAFLCPASDVTINTKENGKVTPIILADDWKRIDPVTLLMRLGSTSLFHDPSSDEYKKFATSMMLIYDEHHNEIGRASLFQSPILTWTMPEVMYINRWVQSAAGELKYTGFVTTPSGFKIEPMAYAIKKYLQKHLNVSTSAQNKTTLVDLDNQSLGIQRTILEILNDMIIHGILHGTVSTVTRDEAHIPVRYLANWATEQGDIIKSLVPSEYSVLYEIACRIEVLGGEISALPIARISDKWCSEDDIERHLSNISMVTIMLLRLDYMFSESYRRENLKDNICTTFYGYTSTQKHEYVADNLFDYLSKLALSDMEPSRYLVGFIKYVLRAVCKTWKVKPSQLRDSLPLKVDGTLLCEREPFPSVVIERAKCLKNGF